MNGRPTLTGYAATFWAVTKTPKLGSYHRIAPGAFADSIRTDEILACWKHDWCLESASNRGAGSSLTLTENSRGLTFEIRPYEDRKWIDSAIAEIRDGRVRGMSPAYQIVDYRDDLLGSGQLVRTVLRANLLDLARLFSERSRRRASTWSSRRPFRRELKGT